MKVEELLNVTFDESPPPTKLSPLVDDDVGEEEAIKNNTKVINTNNEEDESIEVDEVVNIKESKNHPLEQVIARLESIRILLVIGCANDFKLYQMDVKSAFLNRFINEEVYVAQPPGFIDFEKPNYVYKPKKALYGLKKAPKACMMGELSFFLGLQIKQMEDEIFFNQSKYIKEMLKKFGLEDSKPTKKPMSTKIKLTKDGEAESVDSTKYRGVPGRASGMSTLFQCSGVPGRASGMSTLFQCSGVPDRASGVPYKASDMSTLFQCSGVLDWASVLNTRPYSIRAPSIDMSFTTLRPSAIFHQLSHKLSRELLSFVDLYSRDIVSRNVVTLHIPSPFVLVVVVMLLLSGP
ncbi:retrovirus-related pol polyprotein from transposon TNT 1-94 [Tanacetum coccineum]